MAGQGGKNWTFGEEAFSADINGYLADQVVMRFADATARDAGFGGAGQPTLTQGMACYLDDSNQLAIYDGAEWLGVSRNRDRNVVINGAMQVAQRGTSTTGITTDGYYTADRWRANFSSLGTWTQSVENDAPTGSGFRKSLKMLCTTADTSPAASDLALIDQRIEGQNIQHIAKGNSSAKKLTLSFWIKSNVTGTYAVSLLDVDNTRAVSAQYTISSSATWQKTTITFPADTTGAFDNDNAASLRLLFWLSAGSGLTSGTLQTAWGSTVDANLAVGQTNVAAATNNYWQITGVQLEAGAVATPFEFEDFGTTLTKCQRYFQKSYNVTSAPGSITNAGSVLYDNVGGGTRVSVSFVVSMRGNPSSVTFYNPVTGTAGQTRNISAGSNVATSGALDPGTNRFGFDSGVIATGAIGTFHWTADAEL